MARKTIRIPVPVMESILDLHKTKPHLSQNALIVELLEAGLKKLVK